MFSEARKSEKAEESEVRAQRGPGLLSYLQVVHWLRIVAGFLGILLPVFLVIGEWKLLDATEWEARGSLSEYYHSGVRDFFVGILVIVGLVLFTYRLPEWRRSITFWLTALAGIGAVGVALIPTGIPCELREVKICEQLVPTGTRCYISDDLPKGCTAREHINLPPQDKVRPTAVQNFLSEKWSQRLHYVSTGTFIGPLLVLCVIFALQERYGGASTKISGGLFGFHGLMVLLMVAGGLYILYARTNDDLDDHAIYWGEVMATLGFGLSWLVKGWHREVLFPSGNDPGNGGPQPQTRTVVDARDRRLPT